MNLIIVAAAAVLSATQPPATAPATRPSAPASRPAAPGYDGELRNLVERALQAYAAAQRYEDAVAATIDLEFEGKSPFTAPDPRQLSLACARPGRLNLRTGIYHILSDGK